MTFDTSTRRHVRRIIYDSYDACATWSGPVEFFTDPADKTALQMMPIMRGQLPTGDSMMMESLTISVPMNYDEQDMKALDVVDVSFIAAGRTHRLQQIFRDWYEFHPPVIVPGGTSFMVQLYMPIAQSGLTRGRWHVYLHGIYEYGMMPERGEHPEIPI